MRWLKRGIWKVVIAIAGVLFLVLLLIGILISTVSAQGSIEAAATPAPTTVQATPTVGGTMTALQKEQLIQQVAQGQRTWGNWLWSNGAALLSTLVVVVGGLIGFLRWLGDQRSAKDADERTAQTEREAAIRRAETEQEIALENHREASLQTYIDRMSELLLEKNLRSSQPGDVVREVARVRTLSILPQLDSARKKSVLRFLYESDLILTHNTIVDLRYVKLQGADLHRATFKGINLSKTNLRYADLIEAELDQADLSGAKLEGANLNQANLAEANLSGADLRSTNIQDALSLEKTNLHGVKGLTENQLKACKAKGAIIDEVTMASAPLSTVPPPSQSNGSQAPSIQGGTSPSDIGESRATSSQPSIET